MNDAGVRILQLTTLEAALSASSFTPIVHNGSTYKYAPYTYHVNLLGDQAIAGIKTFSSSPIVPTPTTDMQSSTKKYVDDSIKALNVGEANGVATLDSTGKVPSTQIPQLVITDVFVVATEAEMLALTTAEQGDIAKCTNYSPAKTFILSASPASTLSNWVELTVSVDPNTPTSDQKAALAGNAGTPSAINPYATDLALTPLEAFKEYDPTYPYVLNEPCFYEGVPYKSLSVSNTGNQPDTSPLYWEVTGGAGNATNVGFNVPNGQFESGILDWNTYADAAGVMPVDGTAGTATITTAHNTTNPLNGTGDLILTKPASNCQGNGLSTDITIDDGQLTSPVEVAFDYVTSAAYVAGYLGVYIYDITNATFCPRTTVDIPATFGSTSKLVTAFFPNATSNNYRICYHVTDSSSTAWTFELDNVQVGNQKPNIGASISPWVDYPAGSYVFPSSTTPVAFASGKIPLGAVTTNPTKGTTSEDHAQWSRCGEDLLIRMDYKQSSTSGASAGSGIYLWALPMGHSINLAKNPVGSIVGNFTTSTNSNEYGESTTHGICAVHNANFLKLVVKVQTAIGSSQLALEVSSSGMQITESAYKSYRFNARVSCAQFSVNSTFVGVNEPFYLSNTERTVNTNGVVSKTKLGIDGSPILANTAATYYDCTLPRALLPNETATVQLHSKVDGEWYDEVNCLVESLYASMAPTITTVGTNGAYSWLSGIFLSKITAGIVRVRFSVHITRVSSYTDSTTAITTSWSSIISAADGYDAWRIRIGQATDSAELAPMVYMSATNASASAANAVIIFSTKEDDTRSGYNTSTGQYTITIPGVYNVTAQSMLAGNGGELCIYKNNIFVRKGGTAYTSGYKTNISAYVKCIAGDKIDVRGANSMAAYAEGYFQVMLIKQGS